MSRSGQIVLPFAGEDRTFRLAIGQWREVQEACDAGPPELLARLAPAFHAAGAGLKGMEIIAAGALGRWRLDDVREPILRGLIGGGMSPNDAGRLVRLYVDERPLMESAFVAYQVVLASVVGTEDEDASGELQGETDPPLSPAASSATGATASMPPPAP